MTMKISTKLRAGSLLLALIPTAIVGVIVTWTAISGSTDALNDQARERLVSLREERATQIEDYLEDVRHQIRITAAADYTRRAMKDFTYSLNDFAKGLKSSKVQAER